MSSLQHDVIVSTIGIMMPAIITGFCPRPVKSHSSKYLQVHNMQLSNFASGCLRQRVRAESYLKGCCKPHPHVGVVNASIEQPVC